MATIGAINVAVRANTKDFNKKMKSLRGTMNSIGKALVKVGSAAGVAGIAAITKAFMDGEGLNQAMRQSQAIMGDLSDTMRKDMMTAALDVSATTRFSATQAAEAFFFLASAGLTAEQAIAAMPQVAAFAQAGNFDLATATDLATDAQTALGLSSKDPAENLANLTRVTDVLVKANTLANASVEQFSTALTGKVGPAARAIGMDVEEVVAVLSVMADAGVKGELASTQFAIALRDLQSKALSNESAFRKLGITVFDEAGEFRHMHEIVGDLERAFQGMSDKELKKGLLGLGFTDKSVSAIQLLMGTSEKMSQRYQQLTDDAAGFTKMVADKQLTSWQKAMAGMSASWEQFSLTVHENLAPIVSAIIESVATWMGQFNEFATTGIPDLMAVGAAMFETFRIAAANLIGDFQVLVEIVTDFAAMIGDLSGTSDRVGADASSFQTTIATIGDIFHAVITAALSIKFGFLLVLKLIDSLVEKTKWILDLPGMGGTAGDAAKLGIGAFQDVMASDLDARLADAHASLDKQFTSKLPSEILAARIKAGTAVADAVAEEVPKGLAGALASMPAQQLNAVSLDEFLGFDTADPLKGVKDGFANVTGFFQKKVDEVDPLFGGEGMDSVGGILAKTGELVTGIKDKVLGKIPVVLDKLSTKLPEAMALGSSAAVSFLNNQQMSPEMKLLDVNTKQLAVQEETKGFMGGLVDAWKDLTKTESTL